MPKPYFAEMRERVIAELESGTSWREAVTSLRSVSGTNNSSSIPPNRQVGLQDSRKIGISQGQRDISKAQAVP
jgi:hypothetical protein